MNDDPGFLERLAVAHPTPVEAAPEAVGPPPLPPCMRGCCFYIATIDARRSHAVCRLGVKFSTGAVDFLSVLPETCSHWSPWTDEELADLDARREAQQAREAARKVAEKVRDVAEPERPPLIEDPGAELPALRLSDLGE